MRFRIFLGCFWCASAFGQIVLYDGSANTLPAQQGWIYLAQPLFGASATMQVESGAVRVITTAQTGDKAGFFSNLLPLAKHPAMPDLDRVQGFTVRWTMTLHDEMHDSEHRAGFSAIVLAGDLKGIELGFWNNHVWAQHDHPLFTRSETREFKNAGSVQFEIAVHRNDYVLSMDGARILSGPLRDYASFGPPYNLPNSLFFGDDTSSASSDFSLAQIEIDLAVKPAPARVNASVDSTGALELTLTGDSGYQYQLESSANLIDWSVLTNVWITKVPTAVIEPAIERHRFYRAVY